MGEGRLSSVVSRDVWGVDIGGQKAFGVCCGYIRGGGRGKGMGLLSVDGGAWGGRYD